MTPGSEATGSRTDRAEHHEPTQDAFRAKPDPSTAQLRDAAHTVTPTKPSGSETTAPPTSYGGKEWDAWPAGHPASHAKPFLPPPPTGGPVEGSSGGPPRFGKGRDDSNIAAMKAKDAEVEQMLRKHRGQT